MRQPARVTLSASTQMPHLLRTGIADILGIPESELRVIAPEVGGGFGQKMLLIPEYVIVVWAARRFACSVAWIEDRLENLTASFHARDQRLHLRGAFNADGRLVALDADVLCNIGAYSSFPVTAGVEPLMALADLPGPYRVPEYRARARGIASNTCPAALAEMSARLCWVTATPTPLRFRRSRIFHPATSQGVRLLQVAARPHRQAGSNCGPRVAICQFQHFRQIPSPLSDQGITFGVSYHRNLP